MNLLGGVEAVHQSLPADPILAQIPLMIMTQIQMQILLNSKIHLSILMKSILI